MTAAVKRINQRIRIIRMAASKVRTLRLIVAADFFAVEAWTRRGLQRFVVLFFLELSSRKIEIAGIATVAPHVGGMGLEKTSRGLPGWRGPSRNLLSCLVGFRSALHEKPPRLPSPQRRKAQGKTGTGKKFFVN
jgi:hypothetical protein